MFQCEFSNFLECALDVKWSLEMTLMLVVTIKGWRMMGFVVPLIIFAFPVERDN